MFVVIVELIQQLEQRFTVDYGRIQYSRNSIFPLRGNNADSDISGPAHRGEVCYDIQSIREVKEKSNSIIIYGDIVKRYIETFGVRTSHTSSKKIEKLKVTKSFKNQKDLVRGLRMCSKS